MTNPKIQFSKSASNQIGLKLDFKGPITNEMMELLIKNPIRFPLGDFASNQGYVLSVTPKFEDVGLSLTYPVSIYL